MLVLGRDASGRQVRVPFSPAEAGHTLIVGATGSGKTVTQTLLAERAVADGRAVIVVDPKGDRAMRAPARRGCCVRRPALPRVDPGRPVLVQPVRARRRDGDRRPPPGRRAVHGAALPAPGAALPGARDPGAARVRSRSRPRRDRRGARPLRARAPAPRGGPGARRARTRVHGLAHRPPDARSRGGPRPSRDRRASPMSGGGSAPTLRSTCSTPAAREPSCSSGWRRIVARSSHR